MLIKGKIRADEVPGSGLFSFELHPGKSHKNKPQNLVALNIRLTSEFLH